MSTSTLPVLLIIASHGYQPLEYNIPKKMLRENGFTVITASNKQGIAVSENGIKEKVELTTDKVKAQDYAGIFLVGGPGALDNLDNETTYKIFQDAKKLGIPFGSICISTRILAKAGVINGKEVTGWNGDGELAKILKEYGAIYKKKTCVVTENIVTAVDPSCAKEFGENIVNIIKK